MKARLVKAFADQATNSSEGIPTQSPLSLTHTQTLRYFSPAAYCNQSLSNDRIDASADGILDLFAEIINHIC